MRLPAKEASGETARPHRARKTDSVYPLASQRAAMGCTEHPTMQSRLRRCSSSIYCIMDFRGRSPSAGTWRLHSRRGKCSAAPRSASALSHQGSRRAGAAVPADDRRTLKSLSKAGMATHFRIALCAPRRRTRRSGRVNRWLRATCRRCRRRSCRRVFDPWTTGTAVALCTPTAWCRHRDSRQTTLPSPLRRRTP
jgi:hypothetical protein